MPRKVARAEEIMVMTAQKERVKMRVEPWARATEAKPAARAKAKRAGAQKAFKDSVTIALNMATAPNGAQRREREA